MPDIVITPNRGTSSNPKIDFTGTSAGTIKLEVLADGTIAWNGANGSLFSIADSLSGSLMSVNDISGLPAFEVFSDNRVIVGQFGANLLLGTTTNSSNGRLQLATHTAVTGGIGFGTDIGLYRIAANKLAFRGAADAEMSLRFNRAGGSYTTTWENYIPAASTDLRWYNGADRFTLTASGNATFSGYVVSTSGFATSGIYNYAFLQTTDSNNFWITPGNNQWGLYFETSAGGLLGGTGDSNRLGFVGNATARFYVDLNNGNGWFGGTATATQLISNIAQGTAPLVVTSTTQVSNLNAQYLNGYSSDTANTANAIVRRDGSGNFSAGTITATLAGLATSETLSTVTGRGATTASQISVNSSAGGSMLTGTKAGGTYGDGVSGATFKSILDNANGGAAFAFSSYYGGSGGTLGASIRADGYAYFKEDVGIGTNSPSGKLDVRVAGTGTWDRFIVTTTTSWGDGSNQYVTIGAGGAAGIMLSNPHVVWNSGNSAAGIRMGRSGGVSSGAWYEVGTGTSDSFHIKKESTTRLYIDTNGNVGIATTSPSYKLDVSGDARISGNLLAHKVASYTTSYPGINSFGAGAIDTTGITYYDTGKNLPSTLFRGVVWTGKHYIFTDYSNSRAYFYDNNFDSINNAYGVSYVTLPMPAGYSSPHGAAWDGRYLWVFVYNGTNGKIVGYDIDTSGNATIIAESAALAISNTFDVEYADGHLYLIKAGTLYIYKWNGSTIDQVATKASAAGTIDAQAITYDGSYLWCTSNGTSVYKLKLDGTQVAVISSGFPPDTCGWAWNGSNIVSFDYDSLDIYIIYTSQYRIDTEKLTVMGGSVGIGTTNPGARLEVSDGSSYFRIAGNSAGDFQAPALAPHIATGDFTIYSGAIGSGTARVIVKNAGNVGIGLTSNIRGILHINGSNYSESPTVNKLITVSDSANSEKYMILGYHSTPDCGVIQGLHQSTAWKPVSINPNGANVGIGTASPSYKLDVNGDVRVTGTLIVQDGVASTNVFGLTTLTKSLTVTTSWIDVGISGSDLTTGSYIIQVFVDNYNVSGGQYAEYYTGFMSWTSGPTNSTDVDEIVLHKAGHAPNGNWINLRTVRQASSILKLQIIASGNTSGASNYVFKFRRMI